MVKNILIVDGDSSFLQTVKSELGRHGDRYQAHLAENGLEAVKILEAVPIDYMVTGLNMPRMDGFELLIHRNQNFPLVPTAVMTSQDLSLVKESLLELGALQVLAKPLTAAALIENIEHMLPQTSQQGSLEGISVSNFLQLIEMEQKTYLLEFKSQGDQTGLFYFQQGTPIDALCGDLRGEAAALEIITWENVRIRFRNVPSHKVKKRINQSLMSLLMNGASLKDDQEGEASPRTEAGSLPDLFDRAGGKKDAAVFPDRPSGGSSGEAPAAPGLPDPREVGASLKKNDGMEAAARGGEPDRRTVSKLTQELMNVRGVRAVMLVTKDAAITDSAGLWTGADPEVVGQAVAAVHHGAQGMSRELNLTTFNMLTFEADQGAVICTPAGESLLVSLAFDSKTLGIIRQKVKKTAQDLGKLF
ncbi:MAG: response regulator [Pseudomonadota bacterium]